MNKRYIPFILAAPSLLAIATTAAAQPTAPAPDTTAPSPAPSANVDTANPSEEIVVTARRRQESRQDVPLVVNAVTSEDLQKLNIREFKDITSVVPGLTLTQSANGIGVQSTMRGVNFDVNASGNNGTIEFYMNDAPLSGGMLFQSMFDVGQIEVLRGPQGTLRGRASPSGSITVTTKKPDLNEIGGYVNFTGTTKGFINMNGALNLPLIRDVLAVRVAGVADNDDDSQIHSIHNTRDPSRKTRGGRITVRFEPLDNLKFQASYTKTVRNVQTYDQVESATFADPTAPASTVFITPHDRLAVQVEPRNYRQAFQIYNWQAEWAFAGQKLNYVGALDLQRLDANAPNDVGYFFGDGYPTVLQRAGQITETHSRQLSHEVRLSSAERLFGMVDYIAGYFWNKTTVPTVLDTQTPLFLGIFVPQNTFPLVISPSRFNSIIHTPVNRNGGTLEKSIFGNVTVHIGEATELSGGVRRISYHSEGELLIGGVPVAAANEDRTLHATIYQLSAKHRFNSNLMVYASFGTSWRPGSATNTIIDRNNTQPGPVEAGFFFPPPEKSKSYEIGFKSDWFDKRVRFNVTAYHQTFQNYAYSSPGVWVAAITSTGAQQAQQLNPAIAVGVPVKVNGVEAELALKPIDRWTIDANASYAKSKIKNGLIPCNDYFPNDGIPDSTSQIPTYAQIIAANGGNPTDTIATCIVNYRAGIAAPFVATVQSEYSLPLTSHVDGYVRGLLNYFGKSQNDPANQLDDIKAYSLVNLYAGIRAPDGGWEIALYAKNIFDTERVLSRAANPATVGYQQLFRPPNILPPPNNTAITFGQNGVSGYRVITMTPPREVGITARFSFGSR
jgi:iron complex outermembrane receptor protein